MIGGEGTKMGSSFDNPPPKSKAKKSIKDMMYGKGTKATPNK